MREYITKCPECLGEIKLHLNNSDMRRNKDEFFTIKCEPCKRQWYAKIFETLVLYPYKLIVKGKL